MYRSTHPFRSARTRPRATARATGGQPRVHLALAIWLDYLAPANGRRPAPAADQPEEPLSVDTLRRTHEEQPRAAA